MFERIRRYSKNVFDVFVNLRKISFVFVSFSSSFSRCLVTAAFHKNLTFLFHYTSTNISNEPKWIRIISFYVGEISTSKNENETFRHQHKKNRLQRKSRSSTSFQCKISDATRRLSSKSNEKSSIEKRFESKSFCFSARRFWLESINKYRYKCRQFLWCWHRSYSWSTNRLSLSSRTEKRCKSKKRIFSFDFVFDVLNLFSDVSSNDSNE